MACDKAIAGLGQLELYLKGYTYNRFYNIATTGRITDYYTISYDHPDVTSGTLISWLRKYAAEGQEVHWNDDGLYLSWDVDRPATQEEIDEAEQYIAAHPPKPPETIKWRKMVPFALEPFTTFKKEDT